MYEFKLRTNGTSDEPDSIIPSKIWDNFCDYVMLTGQLDGETVRLKLAEFNAVSVPGPFIFFLTEQDRTMFALKFT